MPEDTKFSDIWGLNNPVMVGSGGDPKNIATFVDACFSGNTVWPSGAAMVIDNDITFSLHQQNLQVDAQLGPEDLLDPFKVRRHDTAAIWVAFFSRCKRSFVNRSTSRSSRT